MDADKKIQVFYDACTELKNTKFILAETKISAIFCSENMKRIMSDYSQKSIYEE